MGFKCTIWLFYDGNKLISECYLWVAEHGALPGLFVPVPLLFMYMTEKQSLRTESHFDMDIGYFVCASIYHTVCIKVTACGYAYSVHGFIFIDLSYYVRKQC